MLRHFGSSMWMGFGGTEWRTVSVAVAPHGRMNLWEDLGPIWMFGLLGRTTGLLTEKRAAEILLEFLTVILWTLTSQSETYWRLN